jgi:hypothetical protein
VAIAGRYPPDPAAAALYGARFREFVGLYHRNRKAFARLNAGAQ